MILDDAYGTPLFTFHFFNSLLNRIKLEGHKVKLLRNDISYGVCSARNKLIDEDDFDNKYVLRLDDDCIINTDYIERLIKLNVEVKGMVTGVVPLLAFPEIIRSKNKWCFRKSSDYWSKNC